MAIGQCASYRDCDHHYAHLSCEFWLKADAHLQIFIHHSLRYKSITDFQTIIWQLPRINCRRTANSTSDLFRFGFEVWGAVYRFVTIKSSVRLHTIVKRLGSLFLCPKTHSNNNNPLLPRIQTIQLASMRDRHILAHAHTSRQNQKLCLIIYTQKGKRTIPETLFIFLWFSRLHVFWWRNTNQNIHFYNMPFNRRESILRRRLYFSFVRSCFFFSLCLSLFSSSTTFQSVFQMSNSTAPYPRTLCAYERVKCGTSTLMYSCTNPYGTTSCV